MIRVYTVQQRETKSKKITADKVLDMTNSEQNYLLTCTSQGLKRIFFCFFFFLDACVKRLLKENA